jgi:hypothetical protein
MSRLLADRVGNPADGVLADGGEVRAGRIDEGDAPRILTATIRALQQDPDEPSRDSGPRPFVDPL